MELKTKHCQLKVRHRCSLEKFLPLSQGGRRGVMKVERWFVLLGEPEGRVRSLDEPEKWPRYPLQGKKCQVQKEIIL